MVEDLILSGVEDHAFGPTNVREHFPEEGLALGRNRSTCLIVLWSGN